jgi:Acyl-CoA reductase (LuxC)
MSTVVQLPRGEDIEIASVLERMAAAPRSHPFAPALIETLAILSKAILSDHELRRRAEAVALGYWLRPASLEQMRQSFLALKQPSRYRVPAGFAFHVPPANVDTMFIYSWALSFLCGNTALVRLSQRRSSFTVRLVEILSGVLAARGSCAEGTAFISYGHDAAITAAISQRVDLRVIWGGDASVAAIREVPLSPHAKEVVFADRLSLSILSAPAWLALDAAAQNELARRAFNDIYSFDQMACSSARVVVWAGTSDEALSASAAFSKVLRAEIFRRRYDVAPATALAKLSAACRAAIDWPLTRVDFVDLSWVVLDLGDARPSRLPHESCGGGIVAQMRIDRLDDLVPLLDRRVQTVAHFGFAHADLENFVHQACGRGGDRVVPIGEAMNFSSAWDGYDLLQEFTRVVELRTNDGNGPKPVKPVPASRKSADDHSGDRVLPSSPGTPA